MNFFKSLSPLQVSLIVGIFAPVIHWLVDRVRHFTSVHNWIISFLLPLLGVIALMLLGNDAFNKMFPIYASAYATAQVFYFVAVRWWNQNQAIIEAAPSEPSVNF